MGSIGKAAKLRATVSQRWNVAGVAVVKRSDTDIPRLELHFSIQRISQCYKCTSFFGPKLRPSISNDDCQSQLTNPDVARSRHDLSHHPRVDPLLDFQCQGITPYQTPRGNPDSFFLMSQQITYRLESNFEGRKFAISEALFITLKTERPVQNFFKGRWVESLKVESNPKTLLLEASRYLLD